MPRCLFVSDLHGNTERYEKLFRIISSEKPEVVFLGGDLLPTGLYSFTSDRMVPEDFLKGFLEKRLRGLKHKLCEAYPEIFLIMGNDDGRVYEPLVEALDDRGLIHYVHGRSRTYGSLDIYGYAFVPPTPFLLKDWEKYDVSRYVDPGCIPPEEGSFTVETDRKRLTYETIKKDLDQLTLEKDLSGSVFLFHTPPYGTCLDRAALDGKFYENVPLDVHVGSIAVKRMIEERQPMLTLHGHIHEAASLTGDWKEKTGSTLSLNGAHNGPELALIRFDTDNLTGCSRELI